MATKIHPIFILGIIFCAVPALVPIIGWSLPGWLYGVGIFLILAGAGLTAMKGDEV